MKKSERANIVKKLLDKKYPQTPIPLDHKDNFSLLIAVLLSAQCTDERVNQITPTLFEIADTPEKMLKMSQKQIEKIIRPCGLSPQKSKAIRGLSRLLVDKHNSDVPNNFYDLEELPGVGHKTASVVMSQAFGVPAFPVDTHIHRLAWRWGLSNGKNVEKMIEKMLKNNYQYFRFQKYIRFPVIMSYLCSYIPLS